MTAPAPETLEREKDKLYLKDAELIRRLGVWSPKIISNYRATGVVGRRRDADTFLKTACAEYH